MTSGDKAHSDSSPFGHEGTVPDRPPDESLYIGVTRAGALRATYIGPAFDGEHGTEPVAKRIVRHFNQGGEGWSSPVPPERENGADYESTGPLGTLKLQITRVPHDPGRWARLSRDGHIDGDVDIPASAQELLDAIRKKASKLETSGITLVLNGSSSLAYTLANTVDHFRRYFAHEVNGLGFESIWLVGTIDVVRLDVSVAGS
jgi:hypothetical protein